MKKVFKIFAPLIVIAVIIVLGINFYVIHSAKSEMLYTPDLKSKDKIEAVVVLGCGVKPDGSPSRMLFERLKTGSEVCKALPKAKLFLTGDHSGEYNELAAMKRISLENGIKEKRMVIDEIGFSTWESLNNVLNAGYSKIIIVTQPYHMYRALYIAKSLGIEAYGVTADLPLYPRQIIWSAREVLARNKDFVNCFINKPEKSIPESKASGKGNSD